MPRSEAGAVIDDVEVAVAQALEIALHGKVGSLDDAGARRSHALRADSICVHGDRADAAVFARRLLEALRANGVQVAAPAQRAASKDSG